MILMQVFLAQADGADVGEPKAMMAPMVSQEITPIKTGKSFYR